MIDPVEQHRDEVHKIAIKIDRLITDNPRAKPRFTEHIDRLCKMVEDYGQALEPYEMPFRKALEKIRKDPKFRNMTEYKIFCEARKRCPLPKNWIEISWQDTKFIKVGDYPPTEFIQCFAQPPNVVNPLVWFQLEKQFITRQGEPGKGEELMLDYVLLAIVHDRMMERASTKLFPIIGGKWFERVGFCYAVCETFCNDIHPLLRRDPQSPIPPEERGKLKRELREKLLRLKRALDHVQADLKHCTSQIESPEKLEHRIDYKRAEGKPKAGKKLESPYNDFLQDIAFIFPFYPFRQGQKDARNDILVSRKELDELKRLVGKGIKKSLTKEEHKRFVQLHNKMPGAERLTNDDFRLIRQTVRSFDMDKIGDFLIRYCYVSPSELNNLSWPAILKRLKSLLHSLLQMKRLQADFTNRKQNELQTAQTSGERSDIPLLKPKLDRTVDQIVDTVTAKLFEQLMPLLENIPRDKDGIDTKETRLKNHVREDFVSDESEQNEPYIKKGTYWEFGFADKHATVDGKLKGLKIIAFLLEHPNKEYTPVELLENIGYIKKGDARKQALTDSKAINAHKFRYSQCEAELENCTNPERSAELKEEMEQINKYLTNTTNIKGKPRNALDTYRITIINRTKEVLDVIEDQSTELYNHFKSFLKTKSIVSYKPDNPSVIWHIS